MILDYEERKHVKHKNSSTEETNSSRYLQRSWIFSQRVRGRKLSDDWLRQIRGKQTRIAMIDASKHTQIHQKLSKIEKLRKLLFFAPIEQHETYETIARVVLTTFNRWLEFHLLQFSSMFIARHTFYILIHKINQSHNNTCHKNEIQLLL